MKERPILFSGSMVRAILEGRKTMTRRVVKDEWLQRCEDNSLGKVEGYDRGYASYRMQTIMDAFGRYRAMCPYGQPGDRLWCREGHYRYGYWEKNGVSKTGKQKWRFRASTWKEDLRYLDNPPNATIYKQGSHVGGWYKRSSIFMPRWASRITLEIIGVKVEKVQDITEEDAKAEGVDYYVYGHGPVTASEIRIEPGYWGQGSYRAGFECIWNDINGWEPPAWKSNPWVWCVSFKRV